MKYDVLVFEMDFGKKLGKMQRVGVKGFAKLLEDKFANGLEGVVESTGDKVKVKGSSRIEERLE